MFVVQASRNGKYHFAEVSEEQFQKEVQQRRDQGII